MAVHYGAPPEKEQIHSPAEQSPFWAIGRLLMSDGAHWYVGSGSLIAPAFVLTAGHVLQGKVAGTVTFGYDITDLAGNATRTVAIAAAAIPANYGVQGWDIGVARLA
ncbi:MAG TPA: trypsin-like serine protease, partial [Candidatus Dormibacteraeota bacterium]